MSTTDPDTQLEVGEKMNDQALRESEAEVLLTLSRACRILAKTLFETSEVRGYLDLWAAETAAWAGILIAQTPPLRLAS